MLVIANQTCFDGLVRRPANVPFDYPVKEDTVLSDKYLQPANEEDRAEFERLCLPLNKRPKLKVVSPPAKSSTEAN